MSFKRIGNLETLTALSFLSLSILSNIQVSWFQLGSTSNPDTITPGDIHQVLVPGSNTFFNKSSPFLFIGGVPKSGTTLMRVLLDIHSQISCGPETHIFIDILKLRYEWNNVESLRKRNMAAGVTSQLIDHAVSGFLLEVAARHQDVAAASRYQDVAAAARHQDVAARIPCIKEPFLLTQGGFLSEWFPNSKLIHMVRDGRAVSNSLVSRNLEFPPFSSTNHTQNLKSWTKLATGMKRICDGIGPNRCQTIRYEDLVLDTVGVMKKIINWLGLNWEENILRHAELMEVVRTSHLETTTDQVKSPVYQHAVNAWRDNIPRVFLDDDSSYGPALDSFGYPRH